VCDSPARLRPPCCRSANIGNAGLRSPYPFRAGLPAHLSVGPDMSSTYPSLAGGWDHRSVSLWQLLATSRRVCVMAWLASRPLASRNASSRVSAAHLRISSRRRSRRSSSAPFTVSHRLVAQACAAVVRSLTARGALSESGRHRLPWLSSLVSSGISDCPIPRMGESVAGFAAACGSQRGQLLADSPSCDGCCCAGTGRSTPAARRTRSSR